ncbi:MAG: hypothetical protein NT069_19675 [Planctomycetota bacterium]|nr:hypothetical protein [Planctomycetota bacterium]
MNAPQQPSSTLTRIFWLAAAAACNLATSPKWTIALAAWIGPLCLLQFVRKSTGWSGFLWAWLMSLATAMVSLSDVVPFPTSMLLVFSLIATAVGLVPYVVDRAWSRRLSPGALRSLVFPVGVVALDWLGSSGPQGVWGSPANTQAMTPFLVQTVALTGLWGVVFLMHWTGASVADLLAVWSVDRRRALSIAAPCAAVTLASILWGTFRLSTVEDRTSVRMGAVIPDSIPLTLAAYEDVSGTRLELAANTSQADPRLAEAGRGLVEFRLHPDRERFPKFYAARDRYEDRLFEASATLVDQGARLVTWTEGAALRTKEDEADLLDRGRVFARERAVYLLLPYVAFLTGEPPADGKFMENKLVIIAPNGEILGEFLKNKPVGGVEPSIAGDGKVPVFETELGRIAVSICYDADFPAPMRQLGEQRAEVLVLPSGDWRAIAPYHSYMAALRGIENGCALFRPVSHGVSLATDRLGRVITQHDSFTAKTDLFLADVPIHHTNTLYSRIGDLVGEVCAAIAVVLLLALPFKRRL